MRRSLLGFALLTATTILVSACSETVTNTNTPPADGGTPNADAGGGDAAQPAKLTFKPSNIDLSGVDLSTVGDWTVDSSLCTLHGESKEVSCGNSDALVFTTITQPDASKLGVYIARSIRVEPNARLSFKGTYGVVVVALDSFDILGAIDAGAQDSYPTAGGFRAGPEGDSKGGGPGGGGAGSTTNGGGGGSFCGIGGKGAAIAGGTASAGGSAYGNPEIVPLTGGSAGGTAALGNNSGTGGGAIQLVAGKSLRVLASGSVSSGGGGGVFWGAPASQHAAGGGSGGAILIEAPTVEIAGIVAANGGGGGAKDTAKNGDATDTGAAGSTDASGSKGGDGSAVDGTGGDAVWVDPGNGGGGGGGAGRIRINTTTGAATITGKLSPNAASTCATEGTLK
jgi:hypothetical protein